MKIAQHNGNLWKVAGGRKICQALFLLCGLIKAVIMSGVQNNMRTREVRTFSDRVVLLLKYNQTCICSIKPVIILRKVSGVYLTRLPLIYVD